MGCVTKPLVGFFFSLVCLSVTAAGSTGALTRKEWQVDGVKREALVRVPSGGSDRPLPVVFVFHGHGGSMRQASFSQPVHEHWPEALVVFMQGLPTAGRLTDPTGDKNGWQAGPGDQGDRDLYFFDAVLCSLKEEFPVDEKRIYATGHSNGGSFTYLLWARRREVFAAFGPSAAAPGRDFGRLEPAPVIHIAGEADELVRFAWQNLMIKVLRRTNECGPGQQVGAGVMRYDSKIGAPVMTYIHPGGHRYPAAATALIVDFFRQTTRP
jgi:polyhydroxybutyrate depolymerase